VRESNLTDLTSPDPVVAYEHQLHRTLGPASLIMLGIGEIIGAGIFVITGTAAADHAGPAVLISFIIAGLGCLFAGLCYAEFASLIPESGSSYTYAYATMGRFMAWFIGWNMVLEYLVSASTVAVGWSGHLTSFLHDFVGIDFPAQFAGAPGTIVQTAGGPVTAVFNLPAVIITVLVTILIVIGIKESANVNTGIVIVKVAVVLIVIVGGAAYVNTANWHPFIPENVAPGKYGLSGIMTASGVIFFAYIGFDAISTAAQETRNPQRDMPIGILGSLVVCTILYVVVALVLTGMVSYKELNVPAPVALAIDKYRALHWMGWPVKLGALAGMTSVMLVMTLAQARIFLAMARDGLIWKPFAKVHPKFQTPSVGTIVTGVLAALIGGLFPVGILGEMVSIGTLAAFVTVCVGVLVLRQTRPDLERPFKTPLPWITCTVGALVCFAMMVSLGWGTWARLIVWTIVGAIIYAFYGYKHSRLHRGNGETRPASVTR